MNELSDQTGHFKGMSVTRTGPCADDLTFNWHSYYHKLDVRVFQIIFALLSNIITVTS